MKPIKDHTNEKYGRLKVIQFVKRENRKSYWKCKCDCGKEIILPITYLTTGDTKSCGCLRKETSAQTQRKKAYIKNHRLYSIWIDMKRRCYNKDRNNYKYYGARGVKVCKEWKKDFRNFQDWALKNGYKDTLTIDRIDYNKDYQPDNCRWTTIFEQNNNLSSNHRICYEEKKYPSMSSFCRKKKLNYNKFRQRIRSGYTIQKAMQNCGVK